MSKETLPIIILVATLVILLVVFAVYLWEPIYELRQAMDGYYHLQERVDALEERVAVEEQRRQEVRNLLAEP